MNRGREITILPRKSFRPGETVEELQVAEQALKQGFPLTGSESRSLVAALRGERERASQLAAALRDVLDRNLPTSIEMYDRACTALARWDAGVVSSTQPDRASDRPSKEQLERLKERPRREPHVIPPAKETP